MRTSAGNAFFEREPLLVTELFGNEVKRLQSGSLVVSCGPKWERINREAEEVICHVALKGLIAIHENKILHGVVALRKLRLEKMILEDREKKGINTTWKAWWIDFVQARRFSSFARKFVYAHERGDCISLFYERKGAKKQTYWTERSTHAELY